MKDYDYMMECSTRPRDYFLATGERDIDRYVIETATENFGGLDGVKLKKTSPCGPWEEDGTPIGDTRNSTTKAVSFKGFLDRLFLAIVGGVLLLGPMWLMVLHKTLYMGLITTTVCVSVFGVVVVVRLKNPMDVLSVTAAYAAVLVVFVGLTT